MAVCPIESESESRFKNTPISDIIQSLQTYDHAQDVVDREFKHLCNMAPGMDNFRKNSNKNRYANVFLYDHTRVVLRDPESDYIHASYIDGAEQKHRFILTQAPLPNTIKEFWQMINQESVLVIVALCPVEDVPNKDDPFPRYWPCKKSKTQNYGDLRVTCSSVLTTGNLQMTHLMFGKRSGKPRALFHFHILVECWSDDGMPNPDVLRYLDAILDKELTAARLSGAGRQLPPMVIHCASGTGRSGQFAAIMTAVDDLRHERQLSIKDIVCRIQCQRYGTLRDDRHLLAFIEEVVSYGQLRSWLEKPPEGFVPIMRNAWSRV